MKTLNELPERDRKKVMRDMAELALVRLQMQLARKQLERAARGRPDRSATKMAKRLLRQLTEIR